MRAIPCLAAGLILFTAPLQAGERAGTAPEPSAISLDSLLKEMTDRSAPARLPEPWYTCRQQSSYDRHSVSPDKPGWWANGDAGNFLRVIERDSQRRWVMLDADGPGAVVRIWSANPKGTLRVYIDHDERPVIEAPMEDLLGGRGPVGPPLAGVQSRGFNLYLPIPYAKHCLITSDAGGFYYQVDYRTYAPSTAVDSLTAEDLVRTKPALERTGRTLLTGATVPRGAQDGQVSARVHLDPAERKTLDLPTGEGGRAVEVITLWNLKTTDAAAALRSLVLILEFDGEQTVWCPVSDFFGSGVGVNPYRGWWRAVEPDGTMTCRWVMPYKQHGTLTLANLGGAPVSLDADVRTAPWRWNDRSMHFWTTWHDQYPIHTRAGNGTEDFNYVTVTGRGVYVGDALAVMNPVTDWWGEGDEKIYVDGESFPSHFGTGTEDYYGYAWCCPQTFTAPFHAQPRCDGQKAGNNYGNTTVTRVRALDAIPFDKSLRFDMEVWHWKAADVAYAATTYFYAAPGATTNRKPQPEKAAGPIPQPPPLPPPHKIEGAIEAESMKVVDISKGLFAAPQGGFSPGLWSGEQQLWVHGRRPGDYVDLRVPAPDAKPRRVLVYATRSFDYGIVRFSVNGRVAGEPVDLFNTEAHWVAVTKPIDLGVHTPHDGAFTLRTEVVDANPKSEGARYFFGLDCVVLEPADAGGQP